MKVLILLLALVFPPAPKVTISTTHVPVYGHVIVTGSGFTGRKNVSSHLRKPDGSEYPVLSIFTTDKGEFTHDIDTLLLPVGVHELWVVDDTTNTSSNVVKFEVTNEKQ